MYRCARFKLCALAALLVIGIGETAQAQRPFQDAKGKGSIFLPEGGFLQFNVADSTIKFGYLYEVNPSPWSIGFDLSAKPTGDRASLIEANQTVPDAQVNINFGRKYLATHRFDINNPADQQRLKAIKEEAEKAGIKKGDDLGDYLDLVPFDRLAIQFGYAYKQYSLIDETAAFDKQLLKKNFSSPSVTLIYTLQPNGNNLVGASVGVERLNNSNSLTEVEVRDITSVDGPEVVREIARIRKALRGEFKESTRTFINTDYVWFPRKLQSRIGVNVFTRSGLSGDEKGFRPGIGFFLSEKGSPTRVIAGVSVSTEEGKLNLALVAGFNFK
jgi:hypothetical protein